MFICLKIYIFLSNLWLQENYIFVVVNERVTILTGYKRTFTLEIGCQSLSFFYRFRFRINEFAINGATRYIVEKANISKKKKTFSIIISSTNFTIHWIRISHFLFTLKKKKKISREVKWVHKKYKQIIQRFSDYLKKRIP